MEEANLNEFILANMPYFIAVNYQRLLESQSSQEQVMLVLHIYNLGLRALTINLVSQYLIRDRENVDDVYLSELLRENFDHLTTGAWEEIFFTALKAYEGKQDLFFMPELHDFYWDTTALPYRKRGEVKALFDRLTQATLELEEKRLLPKDEAGWKVLAEELKGCLQHILSNLSFLAKYDLIRIRDQNNETYTFELHKGTHISKDQWPLPTYTKLINGWFYLRAEAEDFLRLNPWMMFWEREAGENEIVPAYIGVYDRILYEQLRYLLMTPGQTRIDKQHVNEFIALIYEAIAERQKAEKLTWVQLCDISEKITQQRMATVQLKYRKDLYVQREHVRQKLEAFLADPEKRGFVLVGKSGVGKSNFLLAFGEELEQSRGNVCVLMYDAANLRISSASTITEIISQDFSDRVHLSGKQVQQIWQEIDKIEGMRERQVILCVDAINENAEPTELLRQLNDLVQSPWSWLKVVFTSRPETWQGIKRGVKLAEKFYYQEQENGLLGEELEAFSYSEQMEPFSRLELPNVYARYQSKFQLQTPYESLSNEIREALRDPLNLWLLARTYQGQGMPDKVKTSELIQHYVSTLHVRTPLQREDIQFLENELVPLMVGVEHASNVITADALDAAGGSLYDKVFSNQILSDGRQMNLSFCRLVDADILVQQNLRSEHKTVIQFKYERFYEYFAGKRIAQLSTTQTDRVGFFVKMIEAASKMPFLWGAVRNALVQEGKERGSKLLLQLCFTEQQRVKEMLVNVLVYLGMDDLQPVETLLRSLIPEEKKVGELQKIRQGLGKPSETTDLRMRNAKKIAIEVASNLKLVWVLQAAALQNDTTTRAVAVRYSYYLWQRDQTAGFVVLEHIAEKATTGLLPNFMAFESVVGLSLIIFDEHYHSEEVLHRMQSIWRAMIAQLFRVHEGGSAWGRATRDFIREQIISFAITIIFRLFRELPAYSMLSYQSLEAFFRLGPNEKALYRNLVRYFDVNGEYSREQLEKDYLAVLKIDNILMSLTALIGLDAHACSAPQEFLPFLKRLFEEAKRDVASYPYLTVVANVAMDVLDRDPMNDDMFDFFVYAAEVCRECYTEHPETYHNRLAEAPRALATGPYVSYQYQREGTVKTPWLETHIQKALADSNLKFFEFLLTNELSQVGIDRREPRAALAALELFFQNSDAEITRMIQAFLSRLRIYYPDEVDAFMEEQKVSDDFRLQVRTHEPVEKVGDLVSKRSWFFARDSVLLGSPELLFQLQRLFMKAADCKNTQAWMDYNMRLLVNLIYGSQILRQPE